MRGYLRRDRRLNLFKNGGGIELAEHCANGKHVFGVLKWRGSQNFPNPNQLVAAAEKAAKASRATVVNTISQPYPDGGGPAVILVLAESHLSIHAWPEKKMCYVDIFTCGKKCDPGKGFLALRQELGARGTCQKIKRKPGGGITWLSAIPDLGTKK